MFYFQMAVKHKAHRTLRQKLLNRISILEDYFTGKQRELDQCLSNGVRESENRCLETADRDVIQPVSSFPSHRSHICLDKYIYMLCIFFLVPKI